MIGIKFPLYFSEYPEGLITFPDVFLSSDNIGYSVVLTREQGRDKINYGMIVVSSRKPISLREGMHYGHAVECLLPISNL